MGFRFGLGAAWQHSGERIADFGGSEVKGLVLLCVQIDSLWVLSDVGSLEVLQFILLPYKQDGFGFLGLC